MAELHKELKFNIIFIKDMFYVFIYTSSSSIIFSQSPVIVPQLTHKDPTQSELACSVL